MGGSEGGSSGSKGVSEEGATEGADVRGRPTYLPTYLPTYRTYHHQQLHAAAPGPCTLNSPVGMASTAPVQSCSSSDEDIPAMRHN